MGILAVVIIGGGLYTVRVMTRSVLLQTMLDASLTHEQNLREKNKQLKERSPNASRLKTRLGRAKSAIVPL